METLETILRENANYEMKMAKSCFNVFVKEVSRRRHKRTVIDVDINGGVSVNGDGNPISLNNEEANAFLIFSDHWRNSVDSFNEIGDHSSAEEVNRMCCNRTIIDKLIGYEGIY